MSAFEKILVATDFSEHSARALETALALAKDFGASVDLVHAFDIPVPIVSPYEVAVPENFMQEARAAAQRKLDAVVEHAQSSSGLTLTGHLTETPASSAVVRVAGEVGADLIVLGTRGNSGLKHILLGSVAERVLRHAECAVLTVKAEE